MGPLPCFSITAFVGGGHVGMGGGSQQASRVSSLVASDMPAFHPPAGVSQWVVGPTTPVVC